MEMQVEKDRTWRPLKRSWGPAAGLVTTSNAASNFPYLALGFHPRTLASVLLQSEGTRQGWAVSPSFLLHKGTNNTVTGHPAVLTVTCLSHQLSALLTSWGSPTSTSEISSSGCFIRSIKILLWTKVFRTRKAIPSSGGSTALVSWGRSSSEAVKKKKKNLNLYTSCNTLQL